uniref:Uncharacterized protein n=1 Tax=Spongospora subterranea TaxID=70186 RepID=A0A0H5QUC3_9EUKA|eukprot:CRZ05322.1 hypothetical protein [Spongospora subterranea]
MTTRTDHVLHHVILFRKLFLNRTLNYEERMTKYVDVLDKDVDALRAIAPNLGDGNRRLDLITYNDSCFSSNDGKTTIWMSEDNRPLRPKGDGRSIMVSEFLCESHGPSKLSPSQQVQHPGVYRESVVIMKPGKNADSYCTNSDLVEHLKNGILIFKILHPGCDALFLFDNSQNHRSLAPNALKAKVLPIKDDGKNVKLQRDGWVRNHTI